MQDGNQRAKVFQGKRKGMRYSKGTSASWSWEGLKIKRLLDLHCRAVSCILAGVKV